MLDYDADALYLGDQAVDAVYAGETLAWPLWIPADLTGLVIWLDASQLGLANGAAVTTWPDLSGAGRNLAAGQGTVPHLKTNELNGLSVVRFDGIDNVLQGVAVVPGSYLPHLHRRQIQPHPI